jgi:hypothetical protein
MKKLIFNEHSQHEIITYCDENHLMKYEEAILLEILAAVKQGDGNKLSWYSQFGDSYRSITSNIHAYRKGLEFGFKDLVFDKCGWFGRPGFLNIEVLDFGDKSRYGNYSTITLGRGQNHVWTYAMHYSYGVAGGGYGLSVYGKQFCSRNEALSFALVELKTMMTKKIGSTDTTNDKQPVILATLRAVEKTQSGMFQLSMF